VALYLLRRTKTQVLEELPPRTEVTLHVELSEPERALYEALRRTALETLADQAAGPPQRMRTLAELMRLRRACCHPRLVLAAGGAPGSSSKLEAFSELLDELLANRHKVLVSASSSTI
jgi:SNF2 family DNA or RNA helicase